MNFEDTVKALQKPGVQMNVALAVSSAPNSFEFGPVGQRHKVYYSDIDDLKTRIKDALQAEIYLSELRETHPSLEVKK